MTTATLRTNNGDELSDVRPWGEGDQTDVVLTVSADLTAQQILRALDRLRHRVVKIGRPSPGRG